MIKLTEVVSIGGHYNPETKKVDSTYRLRNFYVNPKFIVTMSDNEKLNKVHICQPIIEDLLAEAKFTKLAVSSGNHGTAHYDVLGSPEQHIENLQGRR